MWPPIKRHILLWQHPKTSTDELILDRRRIYILPSKAGFVYGLILLAIFIASINYTLSLGYALDFILASCGWLGINYTYRNLSGLGLDASSSQAVFAGELAHFNVHLNNRSKHIRYAIFIGFSKIEMQSVDIAAHSTHSMTLAVASQKRGWLVCPRIRLQTSFPFGLLSAWSYWKTASQILIYPAPEKNPPALPFAANDQEGAEVTLGQEEFNGVRNYRDGDSLKNLAWRQMARQSVGANEVLLSKNFQGGQKSSCQLDWDALPAHLNSEQKIARLCAWVISAEQQQISYAFKLGEHYFPANSGQDHQQACLTALACTNLN